MDKYYTISELFKVNSKDKLLSGLGWSIEKTNGKYMLTFISGELLGKEKMIEITKSDFELLESNNIKINDIFIKYQTG
jgi:hypothetical protein